MPAAQASVASASTGEGDVLTAVPSGTTEPSQVGAAQAYVTSTDESAEDKGTPEMKQSGQWF